MQYWTSKKVSEQKYKQEIIERLCALLDEVNREHFDTQNANDCFCGKVDYDILHFQNNHVCLEFVEQTVREKIQSSKKGN